MVRDAVRAIDILKRHVATAFERTTGQAFTGGGKHGSRSADDLELGPACNTSGCGDVGSGTPSSTERRTSSLSAVFRCKGSRSSALDERGCQKGEARQTTAAFAWNVLPTTQAEVSTGFDKSLQLTPC